MQKYLENLAQEQEDVVAEQVSLMKSVPFDITLPETPASVNVEQMTSDEFGQVMVEAYREAEKGQDQSANEFFKEFREG